MFSNIFVVSPNTSGHTAVLPRGSFESLSQKSSAREEAIHAQVFKRGDFKAALAQNGLKRNERS
jgi:hypothetical protein